MTYLISTTHCGRKRLVIGLFKRFRFLEGFELPVPDLRDEVLALYPKLRILALSKTKNVSDAEDIVQDVMAKVWEDPEKISEALALMEDQIYQNL